MRDFFIGFGILLLTLAIASGFIYFFHPEKLVKIELMRRDKTTVRTSDSDRVYELGHYTEQKEDHYSIWTKDNSVPPEKIYFSDYTGEVVTYVPERGLQKLMRARRKKIKDK